MQKSNWNDKKIGAFWIKKTKVEKQYLSGFVEITLKDGSKEKVNLSIFKNDFKKDQSPDFQVYQIL
jgi:hypothetical protein